MKEIHIDRLDYSEELILEFDKLLQNKKAVSLISGEAGVGKTHLFKALMPFFINNGANIVSQKSEKRRDMTGIGISVIIDSIITRILSLDVYEYEKVNKIYSNLMKNDLALICSYSRNASKVFACSNKKMEFEKNEAISILVKFLEISASIFYPLIIYFDDVQWLDVYTSKIINEIINDSKIKAYIILSFRNEELKNNNLFFGKNFKHIKIRTFNLDETIEFIKAFECEKKFSLSISPEQIHLLSGGNPFYINVLLEYLFENNRDDDSKFVFEIENILNAKLESLSQIEKQVIYALVLLGGSVDISLLELVLNNKDISISIANILKTGMIEETESGIKIVHDIVHEYIYNLLDVKKRDEILLNYINNLLLNEDSLVVNGAVVSLISQVEDLEPLKDREKAFRYIYEAAKNKKNISALESSLYLFNFLDNLLSNLEKDEFYFTVAIDYMECLYMASQFEKAKLKYESIKFLADENTVLALNMAYLKCLVSSSNWEDVIKLSKEILDYYGESIDSNKLFVNLAIFKRYYNKFKIYKFVSHPKKSRANIDDIFSVLLLMMPAANRIDEKLFKNIILKMAILCAKYKTDYEVVGYIFATYILYYYFKDYNTAQILENINFHILDNSSSNRTTSYSLLGTFTYHLSHSFKESMDVLSKSIFYGDLEYEYTYSNYALIFSTLTQYLCGFDLKKLRIKLSHIIKNSSRIDKCLLKHMAQIQLANIDLLSKGILEEPDISVDSDSFYSTVFLNYKMLLISTYFMFGDLKKSYELSKQINDKVERHIGFVLNYEFYFSSTLSRIAVHDNIVNPDEKSENVRIIEKNIARYEEISNLGNKAIKAKYILLKAQYNEKFLNQFSDEREYYRAITMALSEDNIALAGLANLLAARKHEYNINLSSFYANEAKKHFEIWGAFCLANRISEQFNLSNKADNIREYSDIKSPVDYLKLLNSSSEKDMISIFMESVFVKTGLKRVLVIFEENSHYVVEYDMIRGSILENDKTNINYVSGIDPSLVNYVFRTHEKLSINSADLELNFSSRLFENDLSYLIPIFDAGIMLAVIYFVCDENFDVSSLDDISNVFFPISIKERMKIKINKNSPNKLEINFTNREKEVIDLLLKGLSNKEIAKRIFVSEGTCRNYISSIYRKLDVKTRVQAVIKLKYMNE